MAIFLNAVSGIIGKKLGMGQVFTDDGALIPVTYVICEPNTVKQVKTANKDNCDALVLGSGAAKKRKKTKGFATVAQFIGETGETKVGDMIDVSVFTEGDKIRVRATSKGKGFQGGVRRHNFAVARRTHGTKEPRHGSTNNSTITGRQKKGLKMPGRMGCDQSTLRDREVIKVDSERNLIAIKGPIAGPKNGTVYLLK